MCVSVRECGARERVPQTVRSVCVGVREGHSGRRRRRRRGEVRTKRAKSHVTERNGGTRLRVERQGTPGEEGPRAR